MADRGTFVKSPASPVHSSIVGAFLREKREAVGLSQRALGQLFEPNVTTQFISNIERGVTPLPPVHIQTLVRVLRISEAELIAALEREYAAKISHRVGRPELAGQPAASVGGTPMRILEEDRPYFQAIYDSYRSLDPTVKETFTSVCETLLHVQKPNLSKHK